MGTNMLKSFTFITCKTNLYSIYGEVLRNVLFPAGKHKALIRQSHFFLSRCLASSTILILKKHHIRYPSTQ